MNMDSIPPPCAPRQILTLSSSPLSPYFPVTPAIMQQTCRANVTPVWLGQSSLKMHGYSGGPRGDGGGQVAGTRVASVLALRSTPGPRAAKQRQSGSTLANGTSEHDT